MVLPQVLKYYLLAITIAFSLFGCTSNTENKISKTVFKYNQPNAVTSLDPAFARSQTNIWAVDHLYNGLVQLDESLNVAPAIAKSWNISDDGLTYRFIIRQDVLFHENKCFGTQKTRKVKASDFKYSFERLIDDKLQSPGSWVFKGRIDTLHAFTAVNDSVFILKLSKAFRPMINVLTMQYCSVVPREAVEYYAKNFRINPVGTGPFQFKIWIENQSLFLRKNPNYFEWDGKNHLPYLQGVRIDFISERKSAFLKFMKHQIDFFSGLESSFINALLTPDGELQPELKDKFYFIKRPYLNTEFIGINYNILAQNHPLRNKYFRQALNTCLDRTQMLKLLRNNVGKPAYSGIVPFGMRGFNNDLPNSYHFDLKKTAQLLTKAGFPSGKGLPEIVLHCNKDYLDICTFLERQWKEASIPVKIEVVESATLREMMRNGKTSFFRASWIGDYPDEENYFGIFYGKNDAPPNYTRFSNEKYDALYEKLLLPQSDQKMQEIMNQMNEIILDESPVVLLFYDETAQFVQNNISGLQSNIMNLLSVKRIRKY